MFRFQDFEPTHFEAALAFWKQTDGIATTMGDNETAVHRYLKRNPGCSFICFDEHHEVVGTILGGHDGRRGFIYHLAVSSVCRGKGIATALLQRTLTQLRTEGLERCMVMVVAENHSAREFWSANGWHQRDSLNLFSKDL